MRRTRPENSPERPLYQTFKSSDVKGKQAALNAAAVGYGAVASRSAQGAERATAIGTFRNIDKPGISVRDGFNREDYDFFRPGERLPTEVHGIQSACQMAYKRFSIVRNTVDMMTDFVNKGIQVVHPAAKVQAWGREWAKKADIAGVSDRIVRRLFREAVAPIRRRTAKLANNDIASLRAVAAVGADNGSDRTKLPPGEIPVGYKVLNPVTVEAIGGELAQFIGDDVVTYAVRPPDSLLKRITTPRSVADKQLVSRIPAALRQRMVNDKWVPLEPNKTVILQYKKDDDEVWATPLLNAVLDDLQMFEKLRMADRSALDGAISHVRVWKLGNLDKEIIPNQEACQMLADILLHSTGGGCMDLVWGPDLELVETGTEIYRFLGKDKYAQTMQNLFIGLGVPPTLTGAMTDAGMTNNFVSLRVLVERLQYARMVLSQFWLSELEILRQTFGFRQPFSLSFAVPDLSDDAAEKALLRDLIDRDVISATYVQQRFGADPDIEQARIRQEGRKREQGALPPKAGPYHQDSQQKAKLHQTLLGQGEVTPSQVGLDLPPPKPGEVPPAKRPTAPSPAGGAPSGDKKNPKPNGRPAGSKDQAKRKTKRPAPKQASAALARASLWADATLKTVDEVLRPSLLAAKGLKTARELTDADAEAFERVKLGVLCAHAVNSPASPESVRAALAAGPRVFPAVDQLVQTAVARHVAEYGKPPAADQTRQLRAMAYALVTFDDDDGVCEDEE
jgi:hypothetical protein